MTAYSALHGQTDEHPQRPWDPNQFAGLVDRLGSPNAIRESEQPALAARWGQAQLLATNGGAGRLKAIARWNFLLRRERGYGDDNSPMWINAAV